jgi:multidrug resistance efflux pump
MVVDALKNVVRTFISLLVVGLIIYGGIYLIDQYRSENGSEIIAEEDVVPEDEEEPDDDVEGEDDTDTPVNFETVSYREPVVKDNGGNLFSRTGVIGLNDKVEVGSDLSSNVETIEVSVGDTVEKGDVLFRLQENTTTKQLAINLGLAEKQLANAYKALEITKRTAGISEESYSIQMASADLALQQAILSLNSSRDLAARQIGLEDMGQDAEEIGAEISANSPNIEQTIGQLVNNSLSEFIGTDLENQYDFEEAQRDLEIAQGNLEYGQRQLTAATNYYSDVRNLQQIDNAKLQIESLRTQIASQRAATDLNINQLMGQINQAESQVALAKVQLDQTVVTAPVSGTVLSVDLNVGQKTAPGVNYVEISSGMQKEVSVFVSLEQAAQISKGQPVEIVYAGEVYDASVKEIALTADERSRLIEVTISNIEESDGLIANAFSRVNFVASAEGPEFVTATVVPFRKLKIEDNKYFAPVLVDMEVEYRQVEVAGPIRSGRIQVVGGLNEGDEIVISDYSNVITMN